MTTKQIRDRVHEIVSAIPEIERVYNGTIPPHTGVRQFPAVAIDYAEIKRKRSNLTGCSFEMMEEIDFFIYVKSKSNEYGDMTSDLAFTIDKALRDDEILNAETIDHYVNYIMTDGGILHPYYITKMTLFLQYRAVE